MADRGSIHAPRASELIFKFLRNAASSIDMNVDGSSTSVEFYWQVPTGRAVEIMRITIVMIDAAMGYTEFGGFASVLTNGLKVEVKDANNTTLIDFFDGETIKSNEDFDTLSGGNSIIHPAAGDDALDVRWMISRAIPGTRGLTMDSGDKISVTVQDDLTGLVKFHWLVQGRYW